MKKCILRRRNVGRGEEGKGGKGEEGRGLGGYGRGGVGKGREEYREGIKGEDGERKCA